MMHFPTSELLHASGAIASTPWSKAIALSVPSGESLDMSSDDYQQREFWVVVVGGEGRGEVGLTRVLLEPGTVVLVEVGESYRLTNTGDGLLSAICISSPPQ